MMPSSIRVSKYADPVWAEEGYEQKEVLLTIQCTDALRCTFSIHYA